MTFQPKSVAMIAALFWMVHVPSVCYGLIPGPLPSTRTAQSITGTLSSLGASRTLKGSDETFEGGGSISKSRQRDREAKTLYDYLGASPKDTQEQLKIRYTTLVKTLHPDSNPDRDTQNSYYDLSDINAAWEVLKDPVTRRKYDRSLNAKEIAEGIESFVSMGIHAFENTAIPWFQKTADTTAAAVDASTKKAQEVNEQARSAYGVFELENQSKAMEQKAKASTARASKIKKELDSLPSKRVGSLEKKQEQFLSSAEAQRILRTFQSDGAGAKPPAGLKNDMKTLVDTEGKQRDALRTVQSAERSTQMAARRVEQAMRAEELALKRLEDAQRAFEEARKNFASVQEDEKVARTEERAALQVFNKLENALERISGKVRVGLLQQQDLYLDTKAKELKKDIEECEQSAINYRAEAKLLKTKAKEKADEELKP